MSKQEKAIFAVIIAMLCALLFMNIHDNSRIVDERDKYHALWNSRTEENIKLYEVLHRVWIDNPSYVEDSLWNTKEWHVLESIREGDFEDTFYFWNDKDSLDYYRNACFD